jgi:hypothetical protein
MTPFTGLGIPEFRGDEWYKHRIEIFKNHTLKSLEGQTNQFFVNWITFRPEEQMNSLTQGFFNYLCGIEWRTIFTFGGLCFWDDKSRKFGIIKYDELYKRLKDTLPALKEIVGDAQYVYETILASDDMYHKEIIESIQEQPFAYKRALIHWNGYVYNQETGQLAEWKPLKGHLPTFYTIMYPADVFLDPKKHFEYLKGYKSHEDIEKIFNCIRLPDWRYCVTVHGKNISTGWKWHRDPTKILKHPFRGKEIKEGKEEILKQFGLCQK